MNKFDSELDTVETTLATVLHFSDKVTFIRVYAPAVDPARTYKINKARLPVDVLEQLNAEQTTIEIQVNLLCNSCGR